MWTHLALAAIVFSAPLAAMAQASAALVGRYQLDVAGGDMLELRADGSATMAGGSTRWSVRGNQLTVGPDVMNYVLQPDRLLLNVGGTLLVWKKLGATVPLTPMQAAAANAANANRNANSADPPGNAATPNRSAALGPTAPPAPPGGGDPRDGQARQLLLGSAWCSFNYNKVSGTSTTQRVVFRPDGQLLVNGGVETYNSGRNGSYAGQSSNSGAMRWRLENLRLLIDAGDGTGWQDVNLDATRNSNGSVILHSQGREYAMCR
jgi:hypothetical protein